MNRTFDLPKNSGWVAYYIKDGKTYYLHDSVRKTQKAAQRIADEYMFIHQVQTGITQVCY